MNINQMETLENSGLLSRLHLVEYLHSKVIFVHNDYFYYTEIAHISSSWRSNIFETILCQNYVSMKRPQHPVKMYPQSYISCYFYFIGII